MSNIVKATEILTRLDEWIDLSPENAVEALAGAGLLEPELPEPRNAECGSPYFRGVKDLFQPSETVGEIDWVTEEAEVVRVSSDYLRTTALAMLAAANYAEEANQ